MDQGLSRQLIHSLEADGTAVANTLVQTALATGKSIPGHGLRDGIVVRATLYAVYASTGTPNLTVVFRVGGTDICTTGAVAAGGSGGVIKVVAEFTVRSTGTTGTIMAAMEQVSDVAALNVPDVNAATNTVDLEAAQIVDFTAEWSVAAAGNSIVAHQFFVEVLGQK
jgi:hypothetical protein